MTSQPETPENRQPPQPSRAKDRRGVPIGGLILVGLGVLLLLQTTGAVSWGFWAEIWRFWPVALIAVGVNLIFGRRYPLVAGIIVVLLLLGAAGGAIALVAGGSVGTVTSSFDAPLEDTDSADLLLSFGAGSLVVHSLQADNPYLVDGQFETPGRQASVTLERAGADADLTIGMDTEGFNFGFNNADWNIGLAQQPEWNMDIRGGASDIELDLRQLRVPALSLRVGAASINLVLPEQADDMTVDVRSGASSIDITVPEGVAARITSSSGLSSVDVDTDRFPRANGDWQSPDFETADNRVTIDLRVGVASVNVR
ncbi:MAG: DUF5668 domain-containing protein [Dehalococcoidia bacterium]